MDLQEGYQPERETWRLCGVVCVAAEENTGRMLCPSTARLKLYGMIAV